MYCTIGLPCICVTPVGPIVLGLPTIGTIIHNARCRFAACVSCHHNSIIRLVHAFGGFLCLAYV